MEDEIVIKVIDSDNGLDFEIPLMDSGTNPFSLNKQLSDLTDLTKRSGVQSRTFKVVLSKDVASSYDYFNSNQHLNYKDIDEDKEAVILINNSELERGKVRIQGYENKDGSETVSLLFFGNNFDWTELIKNLTMADIVWSTTNIDYGPEQIKSSWVNTVDLGSEHVFPLENRGGRKAANLVHTEDFRPSFFFYKILERVLQNVGYTFSSTFMETDEFKELVISHFGDNFRHPQDYIDENKVVISNNGTTIEHATYTDNNNANPIYRNVPLNIGKIAAANWDDSTEPNTDAGSHYSATSGGTPVTVGGTTYNSGRFTAYKTGYYDVTVRIKQNGVNTPDFSVTQSLRYDYLHFIPYIRKYDASGNTTQILSGYNMQYEMIGDANYRRLSGSTTSQTDRTATLQVYLAANQSIEIWYLIHDYEVSTGKYGNIKQWYNDIDVASVDITLNKKIAEHDNITFSEVLDNEVKVLDIINDVSKHFNLFWDTDTQLKKISVEPRDDYYNSIANAVDVTSRIDLSKPVITKYNSSSHKSKMIFSHASDSNDKYVIERDKELASTLGEYTHDLPSKFKEGTTQIKCSVLAASYWLEDRFSVDPQYKDIAPITTRYWNEYIDSSPVEMIENNLPRLLCYRYATQTNGADNRVFKFYDEQYARTQIPYVLPHQIKVGSTIHAATGLNLYWHSVTSQDGLFTGYWSKTVTEIINGTNKTFYLLFNYKNWLEFKFSNLIYVDEPAEMKGYYIIEKIENYQPTSSSIVKVKVLNRIEYDKQVEGVTVLEENPVKGSKVPLEKTSGKTSQEMTATVELSDGTFTEVPMYIENEDGNLVNLKI